MNKKSQGLSIDFIIIAALGLIVLVIIAFIFRGESSKFVKSQSCTARDGICLENQEGYKCPEDKPIKIYTNDCKEVKFEENKPTIKESPGQCCISLGK